MLGLLRGNKKYVAPFSRRCAPWRLYVCHTVRTAVASAPAGSPRVHSCTTGHSHILTRMCKVTTGRSRYLDTSRLGRPVLTQNAPGYPQRAAVGEKARLAAALRVLHRPGDFAGGPICFKRCFKKEGNLNWLWNFA